VHSAVDHVSTALLRLRDKARQSRTDARGPCQSDHMRNRLAPGLALTAVVVIAAYGAHALVPALSPLSLSVLLGIVLANVWRMPAAATAGVEFAGRSVLRLGIALLGMELSLSALVDLGWQTMLGVVLVVAVTILGVTALAGVMGISRDFGLLIGVGYGICGASAIAAAKSQTRTTDEEASYAIALVAICGTLSILVLPSIGLALGLTDLTFGRWAGAAVHDVGQVVATASTRSDVALHAAVLVKLARVALLAPVVLLLSVRARRTAVHGDGVRPPLLPAFVIGFLALAALNSTGWLPAWLVTADVAVSKVLMAAGLAAVGLEVQVRQLRRVGGRPLILGLLAWLLVAGTALAVVTQLNGM